MVYKKRNPWEVPTSDNELGVQAVVADKQRKAPPLNPTFATQPPPIGENAFLPVAPTLDPQQPVDDDLRVNYSGMENGTTDVTVENKQGNIFTAKKAPAPVIKTTPPGMPPPPGQQRGMIDPEYDAAYAKYNTEMKRGPHKQGNASQILFQVAEAMANFGRLSQGQQMKPYEWLGEAKDRRRNEQAAREFAPYEQRRQHQQQIGIDQQKTSQAQAETQTKMLEAIRAVNPVLADRLKKGATEGYIPPDLAEEGTRMGFGSITPVDNRQREYEERGDKTFSRAKGDTGEWTEEKQLVDKSKKLIERELPGGEKYFTTGDKVADREAQTQLNQARLDMDAGKATQEQIDDYEKELRNWEKESNDVNEKKTTLRSEAAAANDNAEMKRKQAMSKRTRAQSIEEDDPKEATRLREEADALDVDARKHDKDADVARSKADSIKGTKMPKYKGSTVKAPRLSSGDTAPRSVTRSSIENLSKQTGKSVDELIKMAKAEGYQIR